MLDQYYLVAIDATKTITISEEEYHRKREEYKHCLRRKISEDKNGKEHYEYYYYALEAKLVTPNGFAFSILTEFVENESQDVDRQDCELKAFYRLAPKLKNISHVQNFVCYWIVCMQESQYLIYYRKIGGAISSDLRKAVCLLFIRNSRVYLCLIRKIKENML